MFSSFSILANFNAFLGKRSTSWRRIATFRCESKLVVNIFLILEAL